MEHSNSNKPFSTGSIVDSSNNSGSVVGTNGDREHKTRGTTKWPSHPSASVNLEVYLRDAATSGNNSDILNKIIPNETIALLPQQNDTLNLSSQKRYLPKIPHRNSGIETTNTQPGVAQNVSDTLTRFPPSIPPRNLKHPAPSTQTNPDSSPSAVEDLIKMKVHQSSDDVNRSGENEDTGLGVSLALRNQSIQQSPAASPKNCTDEAASQNDEPKKKKLTTASLSSASTILDDGYGSSSSSPHSSGRVKAPPTTTSNLVLNCTNNIVKKDLHVQIDTKKPDNHQTIILTTVVPPDEAITTPSSKSTRSSASGDEHQVCVTGSHPSGHPIGDNRETWGSGADFLLSIIGFAVDLANVWRFPYLCYRNGGGAFLIPYTLMLVFGAIPLFYMELILGQYNRQGPISVWRICPLFKGVGFCAILVAFYVSFYYNVIIGWALYFLVSSTQPELPWLHCNNTWNTENCWDASTINISSDNSEFSHLNETSRLNQHTPASEFFHRAVLEMQWSDGLHEMGYPKWQLVLCVFLVYCMLYLSLFKGVKSSGKVVWVTATLPYAVLTILLVRGLMLPGALNGIKYYLSPDLGRLSDTKVWVDAAVQIFYSVGAGFGVHLSYASYNTFNNNCFRDCIVTSAVNCFTSFFSGFVIFTYLGFMSHKQGIHISNVATEGPGLVFQVYPEAVATLPGSHFWSMLFFFMLIMLGLDSAMGGMECVITGLMDEFHSLFDGKKYSREIFTALAVMVSFSVALINVTPGGIYMFNLFDTYSAGISLLCSALFEAIAVSWFYGLEKFSQDVEEMLGSKPGLYWRICWKFISPSFIIGVVMFELIYHQPLKYQDYNYPDWAEWVGWTLALSSILMIPIVAIIQLMNSPGTFKQKLAINITPTEEHEQLKDGKEVSRFQCRHWLYV